MPLQNLRRKITKSLLKPSHTQSYSTIFGQLNRTKIFKSPVYPQNQLFSTSNPSSHLHLLLKIPILVKRKCHFLTFAESALTVCKNAQEKPKADVETVQQAEVICRLVSAAGDPRNVEEAMNSVTATDSLSPAVVFEVLKRLNNAGIMALSFFRWAEKKRGFQRSSECYNCLIESLGKIKQFKMVWLLVDEMESEGLLCADTFALISRRLARARRVKEAVEAFEKMECKYGIKPELGDYNRLLDTLTKSGQVERAQMVFDRWKNMRFIPDIKSYTILLEGWGQDCNFLRLDEVIREMKDDGFEPDVVTYGILINSYCKGRKYDDAVKLYHEMGRLNIKATPHIYCTLINGLGSEKRLNEAVEFFKLCKGSGCEIEAPTYNALVGAYCKSSKINDAYSIIDEMRKFGVGPNTRTYDILLHHLIKLQRREEAYSVFQKMKGEKGCEPTLSTYEIMLRMFCNERRTEMALQVWGQMKAKGVIPRMHMFAALINRLCNDNKVDGASKYFQEMLDMGIRPPDRMFKDLKKFLIKEGKQEIVVYFDQRIEKLRKSPIVG